MQFAPYFETQLSQVELLVLKYQSTQVELQLEELRPEHETQLPFEGTWAPFVQFEVLSATQVLLFQVYVAQTEAPHSKELAWLQLKARDSQAELLAFKV